MRSSENNAACTILDIDLSEGGNAVYAIKRLIGKVRNVLNLTASVFLSDFPANDFNPLFANLFPGGDAAFGGDSVFSGAIAGSRNQSSCLHRKP